MGALGEDCVHVAHLNQKFYVLKFFFMGFGIVVDFFYVIVEFHVTAVVVDDQLIHVRDDFLYFVNGE